MLKRLGILLKNDRAGCLQALFDLGKASGGNNVHSGVSIRILGSNVFD